MSVEGIKEFIVVRDDEESTAVVVSDTGQQGVPGEGSVPDWGTITNKPTEFPPSAHTHTVTWTDVQSKPTEFTPVAHSHTEYSGTAHTHTVTWTDVQSKPTEFTPVAHQHIADDITGNFNYIDFDPVAGEPAHQEGRVFYDPAKKALSYYTDTVGSSLQIGFEQWVRVKNTTGATLFNGDVVRVSGASGQTPTVVKARSDVDTNYNTIGVVTSTITNNGFGLVTTFGIIHELDTSAYPEGSSLYLSAATAGAMVSTIPGAPAHPVAVATCIYQHAVNGKIFVRVLAAGTTDDDVTVDTAPFTGFFDETDTSLHTILNKMDVHNHNSSYSAIDHGHTQYASTAHSHTEYSTTAHTHTEYSGTAHSHTLDSLSDVTITTPAADEVIKYNGTQWVNAAATGGGNITYTLTTRPGYGITPTITVADYAALTALNEPVNTVVEVTLGDSGWGVPEIFVWTQSCWAGPFPPFIKNPKYILGSNNEDILIVPWDIVLSLGTYDPSMSSLWASLPAGETNNDFKRAIKRTCSFPPINVTTALTKATQVVNFGNAKDQCCAIQGLDDTSIALGFLFFDKDSIPMPSASGQRSALYVPGSGGSVVVTKIATASDPMLVAIRPMAAGVADMPMPNSPSGLNSNTKFISNSNSSVSGLSGLDYEDFKFQYLSDISTSGRQDEYSIVWDTSTSKYIPRKLAPEYRVATEVTYVPSSTTTITLNSDMDVIYSTAATGPTTWEFSGTPAAGLVHSFTMELTNGGSQTQTWPASVDWDSGTAPTLTAAGLDILTFYTRDSGTTWRGFLAAKDIK